MSEETGMPRTSGRGAVTEQEIERRMDRMLDHLERLLLNRDMSEDDYHAAILDLIEWEEAELLKANERRSTADNGTSETQNLNLKP
jgi:hypothetical protein